MIRYPMFPRRMFKELPKLLETEEIPPKQLQLPLDHPVQNRPVKKLIDQGFLVDYKVYQIGGEYIK